MKIRNECMKYLSMLVPSMLHLCSVFIYAMNRLKILYIGKNNVQIIYGVKKDVFADINTVGGHVIHMHGQIMFTNKIHLKKVMIFGINGDIHYSFRD